MRAIGLSFLRNSEGNARCVAKGFGGQTLRVLIARSGVDEGRRGVVRAVDAELSWRGKSGRVGGNLRNYCHEDESKCDDWSCGGDGGVLSGRASGGGGW